MLRALAVAVALALPLVLPGGPAAADDAIGVVRNVSGAATIARGGQLYPAAVGAKLFVGDTLSTGAAGSLGVILRDNSTMSLGPASSLVVRKFLFSPAEGKLGLLVRLSRGSLAYLSGLIARLAPEATLFETPVATIGTRGTRFAVSLGD